jgi:alpha-1,2-mannosyltransferase
VYTGDTDATPADMFNLASARFGVNVNRDRVTFVFLKGRKYVEAAMYPRFTMLGQSAGSVLMGWEALCLFIPDVFVDSMGYAFTLPLFHHLGGAVIAAYVHYPTISTDMLARVSNREASFNNQVAKSALLTSIKLVYYRLFATLYGWAGSYASVAMVNSSWTYDHVVSIWKVPASTHVVYPPCPTEDFAQFALDGRDGDGKAGRNSAITILSVAQFRPEKDHPLQLKALANFLKKQPGMRGKVNMVMVGGCRNAGDEARVDALRSLTSELGLSDCVEYKLNLPYPDLKKEFSKALIGIHTMKDEHFGIGVVEFLAAGCLTVAHDSAGPRMDIVTPFEGRQTGYLATTEEQYADAIAEICALSAAERHQIQDSARRSMASRFSEEVFDQNFLRQLEPAMAMVR